MGKNELDWDWFDPLHCWEDLLNYWVEGRLKHNLKHHSWIQKLIKEGEGESNLSRTNALGVDSGRFHPKFPCNSKLRSQFKGCDGDSTE